MAPILPATGHSAIIAPAAAIKDLVWPGHGQIQYVHPRRRSADERGEREFIEVDFPDLKRDTQ